MHNVAVRRIGRQVAAVAAMLCLPVFGTVPAVPADESTAHLVFKRTASAQPNTIHYVVKPGDLLSRIVVQQFGSMTPAKERALYKTIRGLNPGLKDKDKIYPGQVLVLPERTQEDAGQEQAADPSMYRTKKGDTLFGIIYRKLGAKGGKAVKVLKIVKQLNPGIVNVHRIYPGQMLKLPEGGKLMTPEDYDRLAEEKATPTMEGALPRETAVLPSENRLDVIREVLGRMNGSITTTGYYYVPIPDMGQVTIDCSMIPVVEFDDGSTVMLDFTNRMNEALKKAIESKWGNIVMVKASGQDDSALILSKAVNASRSYMMKRQVKPYSLGKDFSVALSVGWIITPRKTEEKPYRQAVTLLKDKTSILPKAVVDYIERNGLLVTDVENDTVVAGTAASEKSTSVPITVLNASSDGEVVEALLATLGYKVERDTDVKIFDTANNGFNLALKADYLVDVSSKAGGQAGNVPAVTTPRKVEAAGKAVADWGVLLEATAKTNIRAGRALNTRLKGQLAAGQKVKGDFLENDWYAVFREGERDRDLSRALGYVYAARLTVVEAAATGGKVPTAPPVAESEAPAAEQKEEKVAHGSGEDWGLMLTAESKTNIRAGRALNARLKGQLTAGQKVKGDFLENDWYAVFKVDEKDRDLSRAMGYVYAPRLKPASSNPAQAREAEPPKSRTSRPVPVERKVLFYSKTLPQQFVGMLKAKGTDIVYINQGESKRVLIEKILNALRLNATYRTYLFPIPEKEKVPRVTISLPAFYISTASGSKYLVDYNVDSEIYNLLNERWGVNIIKF